MGYCQSKINAIEPSQIRPPNAPQELELPKNQTVQRLNPWLDGFVDIPLDTDSEIDETEN